MSNVVAPGRGFHISVTLEHPPNSQVYIIPSIISNISQGITFEPNSLEFTHG